ncbi:hypothetical protein PGTUg99_017155 [Puccinia graminis f. sp. tritici]|uniref:Uncharacterized protein n=1 Tax=Puccinia graminis f. sp. tritici TaxID=56615 RepID=A0A5B0QU03_PUCGR|nr:hypothetical protein PGTUg99_017155 [Puccinia graminis f. sp. tritici]
MHRINLVSSAARSELAAADNPNGHGYSLMSVVAMGAHDSKPTRCLTPYNYGCIFVHPSKATVCDSFKKDGSLDASVVQRNFWRANWIQSVRMSGPLASLASPSHKLKKEYLRKVEMLIAIAPKLWERSVTIQCVGPSCESNIRLADGRTQHPDRQVAFPPKARREDWRLRHKVIHPIE